MRPDVPRRNGAYRERHDGGGDPDMVAAVAALHLCGDDTFMEGVSSGDRNSADETER
jgi:hypothetical protein